MTETIQLKTFFSPALVARLADMMQQAHGSFPRRAFITRATAGLESLELLGRARHIARALATHLPEHYPDALAIVLRSLGPVHATDELEGVGMAPFFYLPHTIFVAERGLEHFDLSLAAQHALTQRCSCEFSIRPFIAHDPERVMTTLATWALDRSAHVRRLVSEGTRLRLPWGQRVRWLDHNPERVIALLELLKDDPTTLVRRSVANNLNDMGKVHGPLLMRTCKAWLSASAERRPLVEHALRSAVKRGDTQALAILGFGKKADVRVSKARFEPARVPIGGTVRVTFEVTSIGKRKQELLVDLAVCFVKANGQASPKVFKLGRVTLAPGESASFGKVISLRVHTTRKPYPGLHEVRALVNGATTAIGAFTVTRG